MVYIAKIFSHTYMIPCDALQLDIGPHYTLRPFFFINKHVQVSQAHFKERKKSVTWVINFNGSNSCFYFNSMLKK
jgi:DNA topoisomerase VI subunit A